MLGGLTIYPQVANFLQCISAKNYEKWLAVDKVIAKIIRLTFFGPPCSFLIIGQRTRTKQLGAGRSGLCAPKTKQNICPEYIQFVFKSIYKYVPLQS